MEIDFLIIGAGFAGLVLAERLSSQLKKSCCVVDRRGHIGGNCYDEYDEHNVLVHRYGPHYFRTNSRDIRDYLGQFTGWKAVTYKVLSYCDGVYWSFPINLRTFEQLMARPVTEGEFGEYLEKRRIPIANPVNSEEVIVSQVGWELYNKFFKNYTIKQWNLQPRDLDASVCGRIPVRLNADDRYFEEEFQALPADGYTKMFENMLNRTSGVRLLLNTSFRDVAKEIRAKKIIYTGPIDEYFDCCYGKLPYRSLRFEREYYSVAKLREMGTEVNRNGYFQPEMQVNYPNEQDYTRIVEMKHATKQVCAGTTIVREYPLEYRDGGEPYYPVPTKASGELYKRYKALAEQERSVRFVGRLATYKYLNMDQVVGLALKEFRKIASGVD